ncbi:hypothetical protein GGI25_000245 [Coemansia spiralis]|uniref:F-box domain-containing protein n=2 Tax=Coemansia TaxID=4863 RepID=A0A9W8G7U1_9FUNG|nr:hypothetical protein BX070DRAFT_253819 [Coemansia spiralis]KAJ1995880.1 hypothetical protein EDC05_000540 [Coemansia umbellata]KAJ2625819.1 hypothetical protein GGI26_000280 [Coemansia sp. RSA 1358]KAJ2680941.1 hypothetical protein GGI25_000245 [Coemansia spiralis]
MEPQEPEEEYCTCSAIANHQDEHAPTCLLYTPLSSSMDIPAWPRRSSTTSGSICRGSSNNTRPPSYSGGYGMGIFNGSNMYHYPPPSNVSSIAASYASTSSMLDSMAATETESLSSYPIKRSVSVSSFLSTASSFHLLPTEVWRQIFLYLSLDDLRSVVMVSRQLRSAGNPLLWRTMAFPLDKRRLASLRPALSHFGHLVRKVIITPPQFEPQPGFGGRSSRRVSTSNSRSLSLSRPMSRSGSLAPQQSQQHNARNNSEGSVEHSSALLSSATTASIPGTIHSGFASGTSSPQQQPSSISHMPPPSPMSLSSVSASASASRQRPPSSSTTPQPDLSVSATPGSSGGGGTGRRLSRASVATLPSPMLPPVYAVPIPGTPGPGNVISESMPQSASGSSWGAVTGLGALGAIGTTGGSTSRMANQTSHHGSSAGHGYSYQYHEVSEGTVLRMHQYMERYCPGVLEAVVKNPTGISSHSRRLGILIRLFQAYPRLERLDLSDFIMWDTQPLQLVSEQLLMLKSLDVTNRVELSDADLLPVVESCPRLRELRIRATNASDATIYAIINNLSQSLVSLNVGGCPVSSAAMSELVTKCIKLRVLQTWSCLRLDDSFLLSLNPEILTSLEVLDMMDVQKFSIETVQRTFGEQTWPYLKYLRIRAKCVREDFAGIPRRAVLKLNSTTILD